MSKTVTSPSVSFRPFRCPSDCAVSDWTEWTQCEPYCSGNLDLCHAWSVLIVTVSCEMIRQGSRNRTRSKITAAADGGKPCGPLLETKARCTRFVSVCKCYVLVCLGTSSSKACGNFCMDCQVTDWTAWTSCSKSCDGGLSNRTRTEVHLGVCWALDFLGVLVFNVFLSEFCSFLHSSIRIRM